MVCCCKKAQCPVNQQLVAMERQLHELRRQLSSTVPQVTKSKQPTTKKQSLPWDWQFTHNDQRPRA